MIRVFRHRPGGVEVVRVGGSGVVFGRRSFSDPRGSFAFVRVGRGSAAAAVAAVGERRAQLRVAAVASRTGSRPDGVGVPERSFARARSARRRPGRPASVCRARRVRRKILARCVSRRRRRTGDGAAETRRSEGSRERSREPIVVWSTALAEEPTAAAEGLVSLVSRVGDTAEGRELKGMPVRSDDGSRRRAERRRHRDFDASIVREMGRPSETRRCPAAEATPARRRRRRSRNRAERRSRTVVMQTAGPARGAGNRVHGPPPSRTVRMVLQTTRPVPVHAVHRVRSRRVLLSELRHSEISGRSAVLKRGGRASVGRSDGGRREPVGRSAGCGVFELPSREGRVVSSRSEERVEVLHARIRVH